jgi:hypothetical protein
VRQLTQIEVSFSEPVAGVDAGDLLINGVPASGISVTGPGRYLFTFPQPANGAVSVAWSTTHGIVDFAANPFAGGPWSYTLDPNFQLPQIRINEVLAANITGLADEDLPPEPQDWIEIWNYGPTAVNLNGYSLTDDRDDPGRWTFPATNLASGQFLVVFASGKDRKSPTNSTHRLHTNFKLNPNGEYLGLYNAELPRVAITEFTPEYPEQRNDYSYGYDTTNSLKYFASPSPGAANGASAIAAILPPPHFNVDRGMFETPFTLILSSPVPGASILYTTDGTEPTLGSPSVRTYSEPFTVSTTTVPARSGFQERHAAVGNGDAYVPFPGSGGDAAEPARRISHELGAKFRFYGWGRSGRLRDGHGSPARGSEQCEFADRSGKAAASQGWPARAPGGVDRDEDRRHFRHRWTLSTQRG